MFTGSCLCGGIRFAIDGQLGAIQLCHCAQCRKAQGTPFAANTPVAAAAFKLQSGAELMNHFESSPGKQRAFCSRCGSPIYSRRASLPDVLRIRTGLLDQPLPVKPAWHAFVADKANWWTLADDDIPHFPGAAP